MTARRTEVDFARVLRDPRDTYYPTATRIVLVVDNLNAHELASLYEAFPAAEARRSYAPTHTPPARKTNRPGVARPESGRFRDEGARARDRAGPPAGAPHATDLRAGAKRGTVTAVVADRGYDGDAIAAEVRGLRARVVIPPVARRTKRRRYGKRLYKGRNGVERFRSKVTPGRRVATRFDKRDTCHRAFVQLASALAALRHP